MGDHRLGASSFASIFLKILSMPIPKPVVLVFVAKKHPTFKSRYKGRVQAVTEYAKTIKDFDDLIDPRTLAHHFLGLEPSSFVL